MKILYAIQGTGNGHLSRAKDIIPVLQQYGDLDILVSGIQADINLPYPIKYQLKGWSFIFGKSGGIAIWESIKNIKFIRFIKEIKSIPVAQYDIIINDFEPITAWATKLKGISCLGLSHQNAVFNVHAPKNRNKRLIDHLILKYYAPTSFQYGFHFEKYDKHIFTPVIRQEIRDLKTSKKGHYTVYLPSYSDQKIIKYLSQFKNVKWEVFSKHSDSYYFKNNIIVHPIQNHTFLKSLASCSGVLCGAGFETPAEALYLEKKLLVVPMKNQYEQQCNAAALEKMGVPVIKKLNSKGAEKINTWLKNNRTISVNYPNETEEIIEQAINEFLELNNGKEAYQIT